MLTSLKCPMCSSAAVTLVPTGEWLCVHCGCCGIAGVATGKVFSIRERRSVRMMAQVPRKPAAAETIAPPPAS